MTVSRPNIWQLHSRRDTQGLIDALQYPDPEVRKRAAVALRALESAQAVPALKAALQQETDPVVRSSFAAALKLLDYQANIDSLIKSQDVFGLATALKSRNVETVIAAAGALADLGDRTAVEPLVILFQNASAPPAARLAAAEALLKLQSAPAVVTLLGALRRDTWQVRSNAAAVLGQIQATWAVEPLAQALGDTHPVVRRTAAAALRRIATSDAIAALRAHFTPGQQPGALSVMAAVPVEAAKTAEDTQEGPRVALPSADVAEEPPLHGMDTRPSRGILSDFNADTQPIRLPTVPVKPAERLEKKTPAFVRLLRRIFGRSRGG